MNVSIQQAQSVTPSSTPLTIENISEAVQSLTLERLPRHVAIVMDGNGRWASEQGLSRHLGHAQGALAVRATVEAALLRGVPFLSLYAFSTQNWMRPAEEVQHLMKLLCEYLRNETEALHREGVRILLLGERTGLPAEVLNAFEEAEVRTSKNERLVLSLAINYGGQEELVLAVRGLSQEVKAGVLKAGEIESADLERHLLSRELPPIDLLIRTAGERRISNFMLWHAAYAELLFMEVRWPDFDHAHFDLALQDYAKRRRTFGGLAEIQSDKR